MINEEILKKDILNLLKSDKKETCGKYNREVVETYYSIEKMTDDCEKAYNKTLKGK